MPPSGVAISSTSDLAVDAAKTMTLQGGNAVDAAVCAALVSLVTEPGVVAIGGGGYVTLWPEDGSPITLDGYMTIPGLGSGRVPKPEEMHEAVLEYGGGVTTLVGHSSVCTPGGLAALEIAASEFGALDWHTLMQPAIRAARDGFPLSQACYNYLVHAHEAVFGLCEASKRALHDKHDRLLNAGDRVFIADLGESLETIATNGAQAFYQGEIAQRIVQDMQIHNGSLDATDLAEYRPKKRAAFCIDANDWTIATNPPPAVGGACLSAMLLLMQSASTWCEATVHRMIQAQQYVLGYRREHLDFSHDLITDANKLLDQVRTEVVRAGSPSTVHTSAVDSHGLACSITLSAGYGSGVIAKDTGIWLNNSLGELELNRKGYENLTPGSRMLSNMAPTVARRNDGTTLAIGSPGADRITTAIVQTLVSHMLMDLDLEEAIEHPRLHLEWVDDQPRIAFEDDIRIPRIDLPTRPVSGRDMYFGGVAAANFSPTQGLTAAKDPRRVGAAMVIET